MLLKMKNITKQFPGVKALDNVSLTLTQGEILAVIGENGAGKSTLIKILSGAYTPDGGTVFLDGKKQEHVTPITAIHDGIGVIYQELNSVNQLSVAENIFMGNLPRKSAFRLVDYVALKQQSVDLLNLVGLAIDPFTQMELLSIAQKQLVEIAKALSKDIKILIMDEPTAALNNNEIRILFGIVKGLAKKGIGVIYISHRMEEIFEISDTVCVMRDGQMIKSLKTVETSAEQLISLMVGRKIKDLYPAKTVDYSKSPVCFSVENLCTERLKNISFSVQKGEIVGLFGLMGCGRTAIARAIFGADSYTGSMILNDKPYAPKNPWQAKNAGVGYLPADRKHEGLMLIHTVSRNITVTVLDKIKKNGLIDKKKEKTFVQDRISDLGIKTPSIETIIDLLSGGNQQKVVLAKWLSIEPNLLVLNEPTRGVDVGAKTEIYKLMNRLCEQGIGIIMVSSDLPEVMGMSDRIVIVHDGAVGAVMSRSEFTQDEILAKAIGL